MAGKVLWRTQLAKISNQDFVVTLVVHHFVSDAISILILRSGLLLNLEMLLAGPPRLPRVKQLGFITYLCCMNAWLSSPAGRIASQYWASRAKDAPTPSYAESYISAPFVPQETITIPIDIMRRIGRLASDLGTTSINILLATQTGINAMASVQSNT